jgi:RimJ/RimL family protein N-acetyltransferase
MIKHQRITLRHVTEADLPILIRMAGDPMANGAFNPCRLVSPHSVQKRFHDNGFSSDENEVFLVCDETGAVIGDVLHFPAKRYATAREVGWRIHDPAHRNRGYATEAVTALVDYLFRAYPVNRIECNTSTENHASLRMAQKCGFVREGVLRGLVFVGGVYLDDVVLSILRSEWAMKKTVAAS